MDTAALSTVEDAIWDAQRNYGQDIDAGVLEGALERAGWSGPSVDFDALADSSRRDLGGVSATALLDALDTAGWRFDG